MSTMKLSSSLKMNLTMRMISLKRSVSPATFCLLVASNLAFFSLASEKDMVEKVYFSELTEMLPLAVNRGGCFVTDKISVDNRLVGYMYREEGGHELDNGWRFFSGDETQEYVDDPENTQIFDTNTIVNHDPAILPYLDYPVGSELERIKGTNKFRVVNGQ